ncbi:MAG: PKD domain-containing protein [Thermoplasmata archaeon]|nr:PKD domain-containing protein [Thermoplasmata archaeon]
MSKLSASLFALVVVLSTLVLPMSDAEAETLGTNTIYVPVTSNGSPVSTGVTVTLTNVHTGEVLPATYSSAMKLYVVNNAPSGYYKIDVIAADHYDKKGATEFAFSALTSKTISPAISLTEFDPKQYEWNVTVKSQSTGLTLTGATVAFYDKVAKEIVSSGTTNAQGYAVVDMWNTSLTPANFALAVSADLYEMEVTDVNVISNNVIEIALSRSVRVSGFMTNSDGNPASNVVAYLLSKDDGLPWIKRLLRSEEGTFFTFDAYADEFILCIDGDGASAIVKELDLTGALSGSSVDESAQFEDQIQRIEAASIVYDEDFNSFTLTESTVWSYDHAYPGLEYSDIGSLRIQIDLNSDTTDGLLDAGEVGEFVDMVSDHGAKYPTTGKFLVVNDTYYYEASGTLSAFDVDIVPTDVLNKTGVLYTYSCVYTTPADDEIDVDASDYTATLYASYETASVNYTYTVSLPADYELVYNSSGPGSHVIVAGYETFSIDSEAYVGGPEPVSLAFELSEKPSAGAGMEIEQGLVYAVTDDEGNTTKYIVRVGSEVNFTARDSDDPNGNPMTYTWNFDDFTAAETTTNVTIGHVFVNASASRTVNLTVTDAVGIQNWTEIEVICDDADPVPVITVKDREVNTTTGMLEVDQGEAVWFNATYSSDDASSADDSLGVVDFFEFYYGEGNESGRISWTDDEKNVSHSFADSGTFDVVLNVTDVAGHWKNTTLTVKVNDSAAPVVSFTVKNATYGTSLIENQTIVFDANATTDNLDDVEDMYFSWYFADGLGDDSWLNGTGLVNVTHVFKQVTTFSVELNVTDSSNNSAFKKHSVKIETSPRPNVMIDGDIYYEPAEFTEGKSGYIIVNLTNKGSAVATGVVVTFYIVDEESETRIGTTSKILNDSIEATQIEVGGKVQVKFAWTPENRGTYKIKVNVTSTDQLVTHSKTTRVDQALVVKEAPWKKAALWGGIAAVIILVPLLLYLRGRWSKRERKGPRRDRGRLDSKERREKDKREKQERREKDKREKQERRDKAAKEKESNGSKE